MSLLNAPRPGPRDSLLQHAAGQPSRQDADKALGDRTHSKHTGSGWSEVLLDRKIFNKVFAYLNSNSMLELARTSRSLNLIVISSYLDGGRSKDDRGFYFGYDRRAGYLIASTSRCSDLLSAFRCNVTHYAPLLSLSYGFSTLNSLAEVLQDLSDLHTVLQRQQGLDRPMDHMTLSFAQVDDGMAKGLRTSYITQENFRDQVTRVLDCAVQRGVMYLSIEGGYDTLVKLPHNRATHTERQAAAAVQQAQDQAVRDGEGELELVLTSDLALIVC